MSELRKLLEAAKGTPFGSVERGKVTENLVLNAETYAGLVDENKRLEELALNMKKSIDGCNKNNRDFAERFRADQKRIAGLEERVAELEAEIAAIDEDLGHQLDLKARALEANAALRARLEAVEESAQRLSVRLNAYPVDMFRELTKDEWKQAAKVLKDTGIVLDRISASNFRHVLKMCKADIEAIEAALQGDGGTK